MFCDGTLHILFSTPSNQHNGHEDQNPSMSFEQTNERAEETTVLVDKIISVSEVICEQVETDGTNQQDKLELNSSVAELGLDIHPNEEKGVI